MHSPVSTRHALLLNFVDAVLALYIDRRGLGTLFREVVAVKLGGRNVFLPDLAFYRSDRSDGEELVEYADGAVGHIDSQVLGGFFLRRAWLDPTALPRIDDAMGEIG